MKQNLNKKNLKRNQEWLETPYLACKDSQMQPQTLKREEEKGIHLSTKKLLLTKRIKESYQSFKDSLM